MALVGAQHTGRHLGALLAEGDRDLRGALDHVAFVRTMPSATTTPEPRLSAAAERPKGPVTVETERTATTDSMAASITHGRSAASVLATEVVTAESDVEVEAMASSPAGSLVA